MSCTVSIAKHDIFTTEGELESTLYGIQLEEDGEFVQDMQLQEFSELVVLRDALTTYINNNNLENAEK